MKLTGWFGRRRLTVLVVGGTILFSTCLLLFVVLTVGGRVRKNAEATLSAIVSDSVSHLEHSVSQRIASFSSLYSMEQLIGPGPGERNRERGGDIDAQIELLGTPGGISYQGESRFPIELGGSIFFYTNDGELLHSMYGTAPLSADVLSIIEFEDIGEMPIVVPVTSGYAGPPKIRLVRLIKRSEADSREVVAIAEINLITLMESSVRQRPFGLTGITYAFTAERHAILPPSIGEDHADAPQYVSPGEFAVTVSNPLVEQLLAVRESRPYTYPGTYRNQERKVVIGTGAWIETIDVGIIAEIENAEIRGPYLAALRILLSILIVVALAFTFFTLKIESLWERALDSNPLTHLPGNRVIKSEIQKAIGDTGKVVVYCDLDNFKAYNDSYSFSEGDRVIEFAAEVLRSVFRKREIRNGFIGHIGGDDFVFIVDVDIVESVAAEVAHEFDAHIRNFYSEADIERGGIEAGDRRGVRRKFPIMSISMAGIDLSFSTQTHYLAVVEACTEVKKRAKAIAGSNLVMERRRSEI